MTRARLLAAAAACTALVIVVVAVASRLLQPHSAAVTTPAGGPSPAATAWAPGCTLPVILDPPTKDYLMPSPVGFLNTSTGAYSVDASASQSVAHMPVGSTNSIGMTAPPEASSYSAPARHWLPAWSDSVSPDGLSYAYVNWSRATGPAGSVVETLMRFDISTGLRTTLWTIDVDISYIKWIPEGILVSEDLSGGRRWLVDPLTGVARELTGSGGFVPLPGDPPNAIGAGARGVGFTAAGQTIWWIYGVDQPGAGDWVFYETAPGKRVYVYKGTLGDATGFAPDFGFGDASGIWFSDYGLHHVVWHWNAINGLQKIPLQMPTNVTYLTVPAGPCF